MLRAILRGLSHGLVAVDHTGACVYYNPSAERLLGRCPGDVPPENWPSHLGLSWAPGGEVLSSRDVPLVVALRGKASVEKVYRSETGSTKGRWLQVVANPLADVGGERLGAITEFWEVARRAQEGMLEASEKLALTLLLQDFPLKEILAELARGVADYLEGFLCAILLPDDDGKRLRVAAAPGMTEMFREAIDGESIGPNAGPAGAAAHGCDDVIVEDAEDTGPQDLRNLARAVRLPACWNFPIVNREDRLLGVLSLYGPEARGPTGKEREHLDTVGIICALAIEWTGRIRAV